MVSHTLRFLFASTKSPEGDIAFRQACYNIFGMGLETVLEGRGTVKVLFTYPYGDGTTYYLNNGLCVTISCDCLGIFVPMTFDHYQYFASQTAQGFANESTVLGKMYNAGSLCGEAGELWGSIKQEARGKPFDMKARDFERGDCVWYLAQGATVDARSFGQIAVMNLDKLAERAAKGTILTHALPDAAVNEEVNPAPEQPLGSDGSPRKISDDDFADVVKGVSALGTANPRAKDTKSQDTSGGYPETHPGMPTIGHD